MFPIIYMFLLLITLIPRREKRDTTSPYEVPSRGPEGVSANHEINKDKILAHRKSCLSNAIVYK